jgi:two-component system, cell cycle sensor histidine kinase and response regulator CckA
MIWKAQPAGGCKRGRFLLCTPTASLFATARTEICMNNNHKTKEQLLDELQTLNMKILEMGKTQEQLRRKKALYSMLVKESFDGIFVHNGPKIVFANSRLYEMLGYDDGELLGRDHWLVYHPDFQEISRRRALARLRGEPHNSRFEVKLQRKDGSNFDGEVHAQATRFGEAPCVQVWIRDITKARMAESALRDNEERFRCLSDAAEEGIAIHDRNIIIDANAALARMFGYTLDELIGRSARQLATPESWKTITKHARSAYEKPFEIVGVKKDGSSFWGQMVGRAYRYRGRPVRVACITDITRQKSTEEALRQGHEEYRRLYEESKRAEDLYRSLLNSSADAVVVYDLEGKTQYVNPSFTRIFGWSAEEVLNSRMPYLPDSEREASMNLIEHLIRDGKPCTGFETKRYTKDGRILDISLSGSHFHDHERKAAGMIVVLRDITERKLLEEQLRQAAKMEAIGGLAGGIAHDFNNLLTAVIGYSNLLMERMPKEGFNYDKLTQICRAAERAAGLTQQLLAFSRKQVLDVHTLDLNEVISGMEEMLRRLIGEDIDLAAVYLPSLGKVKADPGQIEQILMNLVINSRHAMPSGGRLTIETADSFLDQEYARPHTEVEPGWYAMFAVSDTGHGMDAKTMSRIFDPFFTTKDKGVGTGLGLSTVYGIVKQHHGHVSVYSELNRGTTFKVYLPRVEDASQPTERGARSSSAPVGTETILVVEDEDTVRELTCEALKMQGYYPLSAHDPEEAEALSRSFEGTIHLLLTDVVLPRMDGRTLFRKLSPQRPDMKVLYVSGYTENFIVHHGVLDSGVNFMQKPFTFQGLTRKVRDVLDGE